MSDPIVQIENLTKTFGQDTVLMGVTRDFERGKIHGIVGIRHFPQQRALHRRGGSGNRRAGYGAPRRITEAAIVAVVTLRAAAALATVITIRAAAAAGIIAAARRA